MENPSCLPPSLSSLFECVLLFVMMFGYSYMFTFTKLTCCHILLYNYLPITYIMVIQAFQNRAALFLLVQAYFVQSTDLKFLTGLFLTFYGTGLAASFSKFQDKVQIFFAVLFWMSLFFWASVWDERSRPDKGSRFRK